MESLFSLEVIINYVKLTSKTSCLIPCMAFRLLDYPTIAINLLDEYDTNEIKTKLNLNESIEDIEKLPCFVELLDKHGRFIFSRGKSCLFRSELDVLQGHLKTTPMYLMLLDTFFQPYKLIGTVLVPMYDLINEIANEIEETNTKDLPVTKITHGVLEIKNLLGEELGHASFACRLTSYGTSLLPHIETTATEAFQRKFKQVTAENLKNKKPEEKKEEKNEVFLYELNQESKVKTNKTVNALVQTLKIDYQDAQIQINQDIPIKESKSNVEVKLDKDIDQIVEPIKNKKNIFSVKKEPDTFMHYSPPALIYNSTTDKNNEIKIDSSSTKIAQLVSHKTSLNERIGYLKSIATHLPQTDEIESDSIKSNEEQTELFIQQIQPKQIHKTNSINLDQMPLLKCLFEEMNLIKNMLENKPTPPSHQVVQNKPFQESIKKNVVGILRNTNHIKLKTKPPVNKKAPISKQDLLQSVNRLSTPRQLDKNLPKPIITITNSFDETPVGPVKKVVKEKKSPLKYGTTNTHRMRVLANNPNKLNEINTKHKLLMSEIKTNIDELNFSTTHNSSTLNESIGNNLEKVLFESTMGSNASGNNTAVLMSTLQKSNKPMNYSLLNKVELDSTNDNTLYLANKSKLLEETNGTSANKVVQFGNTYVLNTSFGPNSEESSTTTKKTSHKSSEHSSFEDESNENEESSYRRNIFLENKSYDEDDFHSSLDSSVTKLSNSTTSSFFTLEKRDRKKLLRQSSIEE